ncbi:hypothetical protein BCR33DRAFT_779194 [Rhizoclosmatium globosum]|uniref:Uncharacterized protein n=1 Tax=Rhizoclosmatium globosum TaxID=329046 RepID=A0A1Y2D3M2_9FUNG|nr:hypothetical protein BCR33DRAFT_779194 [Rhizoclosmatium globosum]|eukprot:ORY53882.1 hypothetical protein BCR33DRAFT_779194 [Rhizoclosmatium globosum]
MQQKGNFSETFKGMVSTEFDACLLIEACIANVLHTVNTQIHSSIKMKIQSGTCVVFAETKDSLHTVRWRDGLQWSASRNQGSFLLYKEVDDRKKIKPDGLSNELLRLKGLMVYVIELCLLLPGGSECVGQEEVRRGRRCPEAEESF